MKTYGLLLTTHDLRKYLLDIPSTCYSFGLRAICMLYLHWITFHHNLYYFSAMDPD